jgi:hypothetical protein
MKCHSKWGSIDDKDGVSLHAEFIEFVLQGIGLALVLDDEKILGWGFKASWDSYANSSLNFVPRDHPDVNTCVS